MAFQDVMQNLQLVDIFYPPGSYYETSDPDFDPNVRWGGIWEKEVVTNDRVVEEGTAGIWYYRKWSSGMAECWGHWTGTLTHYSAPWSGAYGYYTTVNSPPNLFVSVPRTIYNAQVASGFTFPGANFDNENVYAVSAGVAGSQPVIFNIYRTGLWKSYVQPAHVYKWHRLESTMRISLTEHGSWVDSGTEVDGHKVYKSESSYHVQNAWDTAKIIFKGFRKFQIAIRSYAESSHDYVLVSTLNNDYLATQSSTSAIRSAYNNAEYTKAYTRGKQSATNYEIVTFDNLNKNQEYYFYVIYQKDSSTDSNDDRGYFYIITE